MADSLGIPPRQETRQTSVIGMSLRPAQDREEQQLANSSLRSFQDAEWGEGRSGRKQAFLVVDMMELLAASN